jgi:hypothetical protein
VRIGSQSYCFTCRAPSGSSDGDLRLKRRRSRHIEGDTEPRLPGGIARTGETMGDRDPMMISSLKLSKKQLRYYRDMFKYCCKNADTDVVPTVNVIELLKNAWCLPSEARLKVSLLLTSCFLYFLPILIYSLPRLPSAIYDANSIQSGSSFLVKLVKYSMHKNR